MVLGVCARNRLSSNRIGNFEGRFHHKDTRVYDWAKSCRYRPMIPSPGSMRAIPIRFPNYSAFHGLLMRADQYHSSCCRPDSVSSLISDKSKHPKMLGKLKSEPLGRCGGPLSISNTYASLVLAHRPRMTSHKAGK